MMSPADPLAAAAAGALMAALIAGLVGHGVLRPLLEARGLVPWTVRDSVGALPLVLIGSALVGGAAAWAIAAWAGGGAVADAVAGSVAGANRPVGMRAGVLCLALLAAGLVQMRLGLLALRKLT